MEKLLEVKNVKKSFYRGNKLVDAVNGISFSIEKGECVAIVGESGSGKSTVARMITNLTTVDSGKIILDGIDITNAKGKKLVSIYRKIQMVFQMPVSSFNPRLTLGESIMENLVNKGLTRESARNKMLNLLEICGLKKEYSKRYPHQVSGGECQRAAIARAISINPELIILDEATSALDVTVQAQIVDLLMKLKKETGISYIFICHDIALVQNICDRIIVMRNGEIEEEGITSDVIKNPNNDYTKMLIDSVL
ncbi:MAG: ATP-binding cassette domain-containing protein [Lachnospiraceae bacterium]|nr:ATP-binding cassette domain-containing protein [Lachnospiraceae bacterium]